VPLSVPAAFDPVRGGHLAIVPTGDYLKQHPSHAHLLIEVADSSQEDDPRIKGPLYAATGVPEYWILAVPGFEDILVPVSDVVPPPAA
jgi:hypothetical protein